MTEGGERVPGLHVETRDGVLRLRMDRPETYNALTAGMSDGIAAALEQARARPEVRAVLVTGSGKAFSAGADISGADAQERFDVTSLDRANRIVRAIVSLDRPVVAALNGVAAGVGCSAVLACDLVVAAESASLVLGFGSIGLMPDGGATASVAASVGRARAMRLALLGEALGAREAFDAGLVSHCVPDDDFEQEVERVLRRLVRGAPLAQAATKKAVNAATLDRLDDALERERTGQALLLRTADVAEGMRAFTERRHPTFRGE